MPGHSRGSKDARGQEDPSPDGVRPAFEERPSKDAEEKGTRDVDGEDGPGERVTALMDVLDDQVAQEGADGTAHEHEQRVRQGCSTRHAGGERLK